jgi:hypothetical protein
MPEYIDEAFPVQPEGSWLSYIEANPVSAGLCRRVEDWHWSSASWDSNNGQANRGTCPTKYPISTSITPRERV